MRGLDRFYIGGEWVLPEPGAALADVVDPATGRRVAQVALGSAADVGKAVAAARAAFPAFSALPILERAALIRRVRDGCLARAADLAAAISQEMGAPLPFAGEVHVPGGISHLEEILRVLDRFEWQRMQGTTLITKEAIGVVGMITPWNWPLNQTLCNIAPALAAGCTMILKPSELAPLSAALLAEIMDEAGVPAGVFNLVNGDGPGVGAALATHPGVDMISFTGSTRAGVLVQKAAADTVKRVTLELGGKSANILLPDVDLRDAVAKGVARCMANGGQSCNAPTRMLVPRDRLDEVRALAREAAEGIAVGDPSRPGAIGPLANRAQFLKVQDMISAAIAEGAEVVAGGTGRPPGLDHGYHARPTILIAHPDMAIAREEVFGPVLTLLAYEDVEDAVRIANDTIYGLAGYVAGRDGEEARRVAGQIRAGTVHVNYPARDPGAPFGGFKQSGLGREWGEFGLEDFLEIKGIVGYGAP
ncbi:aldehyde dehydrogenase family protein [Paracoccus sp. CPCC 101403]|uniref:Aldehyde dehydrogenase family protein n=1 Tax=Paracoccus broussonetiae TaxID=3075834 RepID=A0ABU3EJ46_9RHOB|nr:aldehyde dehydrogenase family protein [Paracoccus sp. CPCC 101403]MDT1064244.1 aldehyde dehydrogenase family protein [Paracoccus sp. CPCC 101403]